jgi:hypothetical protein
VLLHPCIDGGCMLDGAWKSHQPAHERLPRPDTRIANLKAGLDCMPC